MSTDDMERIRRAVEGDNDAALEAAIAAHDRARGRKDGSQGLVTIVWTMVVCYLLFLFAYLGYLFARSHMTSTDVTGEITEMLKVFLLPLVTLVLGYAFGAMRR